ncbi:MAG: hypothetical protein M1814_006606 [Vezdaea aestivalis]|nr:MAG: hypothetical protein M1814_006606 [Vezdaea aestivalis]
MPSPKHQFSASSSEVRPRKPTATKAKRIPKPQPSSSLAASPQSMDNLSRQSQWLILAVGSGACAAFNGVFAKLTTTELTASWAGAIASGVGLSADSKPAEYIIRALFFGLNLIFNGIMWALFTAALAKGTSTTQVSIVNTSANFMITALVGWMIFSEALPPLWWVGAAFLVAGNVVIGRREEKEAGAREGGIALGEDNQGEDLGAVGLVDTSDMLSKTEEEENLLGREASLNIGDEVDNPI